MRAVREIKYRAWNDNKKKMYYPVKEIEMANCTYYHGFWDGGSLWESEQISFLEYVGLHDKNDKEIYEADIIQINVYNSFTGELEESEKEVVVHQGCCFGVLWGISRDFINLQGAFGGFVSFEVLGNVYDDMDLLEPIGE